MRKKKLCHRKQVIIIAGPNGAGKTTFAQEFLPKEAASSVFINADLIARGLSPFAPERAALQAGKIMLAEIRRKVIRRESFAIETTLAGLSYARHIRKWQKLGYHVKIVFLKLPSVDAAIARVAARVIQGGHSIPSEVIRRRFNAGLRNFETIYLKLVDAWDLYDNAGPSPQLLSSG